MNEAFIRFAGVLQYWVERNKSNTYFKKVIYDLKENQNNNFKND